MTDTYETPARNLKPGNLFRRLGDATWSRAVTIEIVDYMRVHTALPSETHVLDGDTPVLVLNGTNDTDILDAIHNIMSCSAEWSADTLDEIAHVIESTGRTITNNDSDEG